MRNRLKNVSYNLENNQIEIVRCLAKTGTVLASELGSCYKELIEKKMLITKTIIDNYKYKKICYLSEVGKEYARKYIMHQTALYKRNSNQLSHDIQLSKKYMSLSYEERRSWITESQMRKVFDKKGMHEATTIDGCYVSTAGKMVGVEIITSAYKKDKVEAKLKTMEFFEEQYVVHIR